MGQSFLGLWKQTVFTQNIEDRDQQIGENVATSVDASKVCPDLIEGWGGKRWASRGWRSFYTELFLACGSSEGPRLETSGIHIFVRNKDSILYTMI